MKIKKVALLAFLTGSVLFSSFSGFAATSTKLNTSIDLRTFQQFETSAARSVKYFTLNGTPYFAVAQFAEDVPGGNDGLDGGNSDTTSLIYQWDGKQFGLFQTLPSHGGRDFTFFQIGKDNYLALANLRSGNGPYNTDTFSTIYKWEGDKFKLIQNIETFAAQEWTPFQLNNKTYLAIANYAKKENGKPNFDIDSSIYLWNGDKFNLFQSIPTHAAFTWHYFDMNNQHYLAVANGTGESSDIYVWNGDRFTLFQTLPSNAGRDILHFELKKEHYIALANLENDSVIYKWDKKQFVPFQTIKGAGGRRFVFFTKDNQHYLVKMNYMVNRKLVFQSEIYQWDGKRFVLVKEFQTSGATDADYFTMNGTDYLAVANGHKSENSFKVDSVIYKVQTIRGK